jgi:hypothetical protein
MSKTIEVYIGFMEEEISPQLKALLEKYREIPVRAISRGALTPESALFDQTLSYYGVSKDDVACHVASATNVPDDPVAKALQTDLFAKGGKYEARICTRVLSELNKKQEEQRLPKVSLKAPALTVVYLNDVGVSEADDASTPVACYVVQSPEMGKQPSIVRAYLRSILQAVYKAHPDAAVRIVVVGAGGGIPTGINPGELVRIGASIFIGAETDDDGNLYAVVDIAGIVPAIENKKVVGLAPLRKQFSQKALEQAQTVDESIVALDSPLVHFRVAPSPTALETAQRFATAFVVGKTLEELESITDESDPYYCVTRMLKEDPLDEDDRDDFETFQKVFTTLVSAYGSQYEDISKLLGLEPTDYYRMSATWSYFDQKAEKDAVWHQLGGGKALYIANSNMEDYHVFRVLESMLGESQIKYPALRDYYAVRLTANPNASEEAIDILKTWLATTPTYTLEEYVETIAWGIRGCPTDEVETLPENVCLWRACFDLETCTEPNELVDYVYGVGVDDPSINSQTSEPWGELLYVLDPFCMDLAQDFLKELPEEFRKKAGPLFDFSAVKADREELVPQVGKLVALYFDSYPQYVAAKDAYYMWLRGKWQQDPPLKILKPGVTIHDHDRMLYRAGNVFAMRDLPDTVVNLK